MLRLSGPSVYLAALEREHCRKLYEDFEYDFDAVTEPLYIGHSPSKSDDIAESCREMKNHD